MEIERAVDKTEVDNTVLLGNVEPGKLFRFSGISFDAAMTEKAFWFVLDAPEEKRVMIANAFNGQRLIRDKEHRVIKHPSTLRISEK